MNTPKSFKDELRKGLTESNDKLIKLGVIADYDLAKQKGGPESEEYEGIESTNQDLPGDYYDKFEDYINPDALRGGAMSLEEMQQMRFENQTTSEQLGNAVKRIGTNIVPQILSGFASMVDIQGYWDAEHAANNEIVKWANDIQNQSNEDYAIYTDPSGDTLDLGSMSWWLDRGSGLVTSVASFLAQGWGVGKVASLGIKGASYALQGKNLLNTVLGASRVQKGVNALGTLGTSVALNQSEAVIEATQVYQKIYDESLKANLSVEEAKKRAANAAATTMNINRANILLNLTSAGMFIDPTKALSRGLLELPKGILHKIGTEGAQEGVEEIINHVASKAGEAKGRKQNYTFDDAIKDATSMEGLEAAFLGALGGIAQTGGTEALRSTTWGIGAVTDKVTGEKMSARTAERTNYEKQQAVIKQMKEEGIDITSFAQNIKDTALYYDKMLKAQQEGNTEEVKRLSRELGINKMVTAFQSGTTEVLENMIKAEASKPVEEVGEEYINKAKSALKELSQLETVYNQYSKYENVDKIFYNRVAKIDTDKKYNEVKQQNQNATVELGEQVRSIASKYNFKREAPYTNKVNGEVVETGTREVDSPLIYSLENLENNLGDSEYNKEQYEKFVAEVKQLPSYKVKESTANDMEALVAVNIRNDKDFKELTSPEGQAKAKQQKEEAENLKKAYEDLDKATTISEVNNLEASNTNPEFVKKAKERRDIIQKDIDAKAKQNKVELLFKQLGNKIAVAKEEDLDALTQEVVDVELAKKYKDALNEAIAKRRSELNGVEYTEEDPLSKLGFTQGATEEVVSAENNTLKSNLPSDLPNPDTESTDVEKEVQDAVEKLQEEDKTLVIGEDAQGNIIYNYEKSQEGYNRGADLSRNFSQTDDNGLVTRNEDTNEIIGNKLLLDPDNLTAGTPLVMSVDTEYQGDKLDPTSTTRQTVPWLIREQQLVTKYGIENYQTSDEYIAEVPIKVTDAEGNTVFYIHDNAWYQEENLDNTPENIALDKARNFEIRKQIILAGKVKTKVEYKSFGRLFKTADNKPVSVAEAMPDSNLIIAIGRNDTFELPDGKTKLLGKKGKILSKNKPQSGRAYAIVKVGPNEFLPIALQRNPISKETQDSIYFAIEAHLTNDENNPVVKAVLQEAGLNLLDINDLRSYLKQFIYLYPTDKNESLENLMIKSGEGSPLKSNNPLITVTGNSIEFGKPGINLTSTSKKTVTLSQNFKNQEKSLKILATAILPNLLANADKASLAKGDTTVFIKDQDGTTETKTYLQVVKESHSTNVLSHNIGTEEKPKYIYTIQPTILFDTKFAKLEKVNSKQAKKSAPKKSTQTTTQSNAEKIEILKEEWKKQLVKVQLNPLALNNVNGNSPKEALSNFKKYLTEILGWENFKIGYLKPHLQISFNDESDIIVPASIQQMGGTTSFINVVIEDVVDSVYAIKIHNLEHSTTQSTTTNQMSVGRQLSTTAVQKLNKLGFSNDVIASMSDEDIEIAKTFSSKEDAKEMLDKYVKPTVEEQVIETVNEELVISKAEQVLKEGNTLDELNQMLDGLLTLEQRVADDSFTEEQILERINENSEEKFTSLKEIIDTYKKSIEIFNERSQNKSTVKLSNGVEFEITDNLQDIDDNEDFAIPSLSQEQLEEINEEVDANIIRGLSPTTQESLISFLVSEVVTEALGAKENDGQQTVKVKTVLDKQLKAFKELKFAYEQKGLVNRAKALEGVIEQFDKVRSLTDARLRLLKTGKVDDSIELDDSETAGGLEKVIHTDDWTFTINSIVNTSADLKRFFSSIKLRNDKGEFVQNPLGFIEVVPMNIVYNTLHGFLANKPADFDIMISTLELYTNKFPWVASVVDLLKNSSEKIKNEFVTDMTKHHIDMQFVMWSKDKNGNYSLQKWSSNSSSIEQRLKEIWATNLRNPLGGSNIVTQDLDDNYVFDKDVVDSMITIAEEFKKDPSSVTNDDLANWLGNFGIMITDATYNDLRAGKYSNQGKKNWEQLFNNSSGLINVLAKKLEKISASSNSGFVKLEDYDLMNDSAIKALAKLDSTNNLNVFSNSFQAGGKTIYSYGNNNYLVNRMRDLTSYDGSFTNQQLIDDLKSISFTKDSLWLNELTNDEEIGEFMRANLGIGYLSLEALKKKWSPSKDNRKLNNLVAAEHEVTKLGLFFNKSGKIINKEQRRIVNFFYPTMSDKTTMLTIQSLSREVDVKAGKVSKDNIKLLYDALVTPEISRIVDKQADNVKGYEPNYFYFLPSLNELMIILGDEEITLRDLAVNKDSRIYTDEVREQVEEKIEEILNDLVNKKLEDWNKLGIGQVFKDDNGKIIDNYTFLDKEYMSTVKGTQEQKVRYAATDYVYNSLIANAEMFKLFAGDPALYAKFASKTKLAEKLNIPVESLTDSEALNINLENSFINLGKRLAGDIAPGMELANSKNNVYQQVFLEDQKIDSNNLSDKIQKEFFQNIVPEYAKNYSSIEGSDAQEYTTWQEHIYVMKQLGRITQKQYDLLNIKLTAQSKGVLNNSTKLSYEELGLVLQPIKPVYVGNQVDKDNNVDKRIYIKSSSFPLIPELTTGLQIDKIRQALEKHEFDLNDTTSIDGSNIFVRASFATANKVGAVKDSLKVFDEKGNVVDNLTVSDSNTLRLSRANFRIQQDVPYQREKDAINSGTQERSLLFVNLLDVQIDDKTTGKELQEEYLKAYENLFKYGQEKLAERLGLKEEVKIEPNLESLTTIPTTTLVEQTISETEKIKSIKSPIAKAKAQEELVNQIGEENLERINFINSNFDKIITALAESKINVFFDEAEQFKKCE
jgi:hypothetical protein